jgi:hypothetical protein
VSYREAPFHADMQCFVESVSYDFVRRFGTVRISHSGCTDMGGCIAFFVRIDPGVKRIETLSSGKEDTAYRRNAVGQWEAIS